ncbi:VWA domain-containing protein [Edaphobacter aggregans]|uniref:VWA domain-containing protein n=1 Tax=Edaphobacter aggregans TaxID=570835 RepID=UPI00054F2013|nr:VWA domain-containing protein [Edaphobacter aggregans]
MTTGTRLGAIVFAFLSSFVLAQTKQETPASETNGKIYLDAVVSTNGGAPVAGLEQKDFTVLDNKVAQPIASFEALGGEKAPVEVLVVVDAVNTSFSIVAAERDQIARFLHANGGHLAHPVKLAFFTEKGLEMQPQPSTDGNSLSAALDSYEVRLRTIRRSSGIYGADERLQLSLNMVRQLAQQEAAQPGRKMVFWISPGWPMLSGPNVVQLTPKQQQQLFANIVALSTGLRAARMTLYALDPVGADESVMHGSYYMSFVKGVAKPRDAGFGKLALQVLATQTGGLVVNSNDLTELFGRCVKDAEAYYEIAFVPAPDHGEQRDVYHQVEVKVARPGLPVRTLQGYYSNP